MAHHCRADEPSDRLASNTGKVFAEWMKDPAGLQRVTHEVWQMTKLDLAKLQKAFAGE